MLADDNFTENFAADVPVGIFQYVSNNISSCFDWQIYQLLLKVITQQTYSVTILRLPRRLEDVLEDEKLLG